ncbi:MAG: hypothetical protein AB1571_02420 [Nanoarchaeota archaeon]
MVEKKTVGGGLDLREHFGSESIHDAFSKILSGKKGYRTIKDSEKKKCQCGHELKGTEKFCPECGFKL